MIARDFNLGYWIHIQNINKGLNLILYLKEGSVGSKGKERVMRKGI